MNNNKSNITFGQKIDFTIAATPSMGSYLIGYDIATGFLSQKDDQGVVSRIGVAATASGILETFDSDILVSLSTGKSFGKYVSGDLIPAIGKTATEVIIDSLSESIPPTVSLSSSSSILFNQTAISNVLSYTYSINTMDATVSSTTLEWRRNNTGSWNVLSTSSNLFNYTHSITDTNFNTQPFNYRYTVIDSKGASSIITKDITSSSYVTPDISLNVVAVSLSSIDTNLRREKGNINSNISGIINRNSLNVTLSHYQLQYQKNNTGSWLNIGSTVSISGINAPIVLTNHNDSISLSDANQIGYRVLVTDSYQVTTSSSILINLSNLIFYGSTSSVPVGDIRLLSNKVFSNTNTFNLNTFAFRNFVIAIPSTLNITEITDLDALNVNLTNSYVVSTMNVLDFIGTNVSYKIYNMTNDIPYSNNHKHRVII